MGNSGDTRMPDDVQIVERVRSPIARRLARVVPLWAAVLVCGLVIMMNLDRESARKRERDLESRLQNLLAGYREQRIARRELYAARMEIERLKATVTSLQGPCSGSTGP